MRNYLFFDNASTTKCCKAATDLLQRYADEDFGNPSSSHALGQQAARAIREARVFFAETFKVSPEQVIFTGSGSEADNLAVYGVAMEALVRQKRTGGPSPRVIASATEHPAVRKTVQSLTALGIDAQLVPVDSKGQINKEKLLELLTPETVLVSIQRVNNIVGSLLPVEELAKLCKEKVPHLTFHTDAVQAFGKVEVPTFPSQVDLISISAHKIHGPKGVGAMIVLNKKLLKNGIRPLIWGGEQEGGFRSGTQSAGLIAGFHVAAAQSLKDREGFLEHCGTLQEYLEKQLRKHGLLDDQPSKSKLHWNSPREGVPYIVSLSVPGFPSGPLAKLLEERNCLVSTGSACSSQKTEPDPVLSAMGLSSQIYGSAIRISFSSSIQKKDIDTLVQALDESIQLMAQLLGGR